MKLANNLVVSKWFDLKPDKDSDESKSFKLELMVPSGTTSNDMTLAILKNEIIRVQNAKRPSWDKLVNRSTFKVTFKKPIGMIDPEDAMVEKLKAMTPEEQATYLAEMIEKATK